MKLKLVKQNKYYGPVTNDFSSVKKIRYNNNDIKYFNDCFNNEFVNELEKMLDNLDKCNTLDQYRMLYSKTLDDLLFIQKKLKQVLKKATNKKVLIIFN